MGSFLKLVVARGSGWGRGSTGGEGWEGEQETQASSYGMNEEVMRVKGTA